ncbi:UvrD-helicase domain-containing protein, partial [Acinetobacter oleivorans]|uniref:UvrD-helicase domain-containing protein n=1 Tax=Acinetobacter oleivorans TaxID=1148157 RepID=UPI00148F425C
MSQIIEITDEDIKYAEDILLPQGKTFDDERRNFIRNLSTLDLQAVPGSGKTTALLAKLLILETKLPFSDGSGSLVLSHTNAAVDEIKEKIHQYCPKLFRYPHFIGTIQSFVNEFLAIPFYLFKLKKKPLRIDNEIYAEQIESALPYNTKIALSKRGINYIDILSNSFISNKEIFQHFWSNDEVNIPRIGSHTTTYKELATMKINLLKTGILSFGDCY